MLLESYLYYLFLEKCQTEDYLFFKSFFAIKKFKEFIISKIYNKNNEDRK